jgi:ribosomal protein S2
MTPQKIENVVRNAYKVCKKLQTQGERVLVVGTADGLTIEMWINTTTKTIETAYPQY